MCFPTGPQFGNPFSRLGSEQRMHSQEEAREIASALSGRSVCTIGPAGAGGNNRVYRVTLDDGKAIALKFYPAQKEDPRDRLGAEWQALNLLCRHGVDHIPHPVAADHDNNCAIYKWIEGTKPEPTHEAFDQMAKLKANMFICLLDNIEMVHHRLHEEHDIDATLKDCMVWREEEIIVTELLANAMGCHDNFYILSSPPAQSAGHFSVQVAVPAASDAEDEQ